MHVMCAVQPSSLDLSPSRQRLSLQLEATTPHQVTPLGFEYVEVEGDKSAMAEWIGAGVDELPLRRVSWSPCSANVADKYVMLSRRCSFPPSLVSTYIYSAVTQQAFKYRRCMSLGRRSEGVRLAWLLHSGLCTSQAWTCIFIGHAFS